MKLTFTALCSSLVLLFTACGQQHEAESTVKDFMSENMKGDLHISGCHFTDLDSTLLLSSNTVARMRASTAKQSQRYNKEIKYADGKPTRKLFITRATYYVDTVKVSDTYYLDDALTRVVAFKEN